MVHSAMEILVLQHFNIWSRTHARLLGYVMNYDGHYHINHTIYIYMQIWVCILTNTLYAIMLICKNKCYILNE
jgi:hypothetical protein